MPIINRVADKVIVILKQRKRILWVTEEKTFKYFFYKQCSEDFFFEKNSDNKITRRSASLIN